MTDQTIAAIARNLAVAASVGGYERTPEAKREVVARLTELCAAVKAENEEQKDAVTR